MNKYLIFLLQITITIIISSQELLNNNDGSTVIHAGSAAAWLPPAVSPHRCSYRSSNSKPFGLRFFSRTNDFNVFSTASPSAAAAKSTQLQSSSTSQSSSNDSSNNSKKNDASESHAVMDKARMRLEMFWNLEASVEEHQNECIVEDPSTCGSNECSDSNGAGERTCRFCRGTMQMYVGSMEHRYGYQQSGTVGDVFAACPVCHQGRETCHSCAGTGWIAEWTRTPNQQQQDDDDDKEKFHGSSNVGGGGGGGLMP